MIIKLLTGAGFAAKANPHAVNYANGVFTRAAGFALGPLSLARQQAVVQVVSELITEQTVVANGNPHFFSFVLRLGAATVLVKIMVVIHADHRVDVVVNTREYTVALAAPLNPMAALQLLFLHLGI